MFPLLVVSAADVGPMSLVQHPKGRGRIREDYGLVAHGSVFPIRVMLVEGSSESCTTAPPLKLPPSGGR